MDTIKNWIQHPLKMLGHILAHEELDSLNQQIAMKCHVIAYWQREYEKVSAQYMSWLTKGQPLNKGRVSVTVRRDDTHGGCML